MKTSNASGISMNAFLVFAHEYALVARPLDRFDSDHRIDMINDAREIAIIAARV
jgi:hypothetical protein